MGGISIVEAKNISFQKKQYNNLIIFLYKKDSSLNNLNCQIIYISISRYPIEGLENGVKKSDNGS
jgi:hypothetical protein